MSRSLDWPALMRAGIQGLRLTPEAFWGLTPAELQMMLGPPAQAAPLLSEGLDALMAAWPDETSEGDPA
ncbi:phage tail assembly chaperone [Tateyamaria omphalii]|uniref:rcc01693 family protein n=1 Tax=Tateyamaria omphalii TaxID=299262 RepID=UPI001C9942A0|nr:rcc01693 family protein [Tateyamaria omphalii]MBY5932963.1 phage tail assembly chaperone [Tateyamaria omphalii]